MDNDKNLETITNAILDKQKEMFEKNGKEVKDNLKEMQDNIDKIETSFTKMSESNKPETMLGALKNGLSHKDLIKGLDNNKADHSFDVAIQYNAIHQPTNFVDGATLPIAPFTQESGVSKLTYAPPLIAELIQWGTTAGPMVGWVERTDKTDGSAMRAEDAKMAEGDLEWTEKETKVKILSEFMKASNESIKDVAFTSSEINSELLDDLKNLLETQLMTGDGTGNNLLGILPQASAFVAGTFAASVVDPNYADVLRIAINQIFVAGNGRFFPSAVVMHPTDVTFLDLLKIADGRYIEVPFYDGEKMVVARVPIIQNTRVTLGDYLVADFNRAKGFLRDALTIRIWSQNEDDVLYNRSTITGNMRTAFRIKGPDLGAFVTGTFATDIAAIAAP